MLANIPLVSRSVHLGLTETSIRTLNLTVNQTSNGFKGIQIDNFLNTELKSLSAELQFSFTII